MIRLSLDSFDVESTRAKVADIAKSNQNGEPAAHLFFPKEI
jgi:hypothetical protein